MFLSSHIHCFSRREKGDFVAMSTRCVISNCPRTANALCLCCDKKICRIHFDAHQEKINEQFDPLTEQFNNVQNRVKDLKVDDLTKNARTKLDQWRDEYHQRINEIFDQKCKELKQHAQEKLDKLKTNMTEMQRTLQPIFERRDADRQTIDLARSKLELVEQVLDNMNDRAFTVTTQPIPNDHHCITIEEFTEHSLTLLALESTPTRTSRPSGSYAPIVSNERFLLYHHHPDLRLLDKKLTVAKKIAWKHEKIQGMCWSSTSKQFLIVTEQKIYSVDEDLNSIRQIQYVENRTLYSCTHSEKSLFVVEYEHNSPILEYQVTSSSIKFIQEWRPPRTCQDSEWINDISCRGKSMMLVIKNMTNKSCRIELKNSETFDQLWQLRLDIPILGNNPFACCSVVNNGWFVLDTDSNQFLYITADGTMGGRYQYNEKLWCANMFGNNILAITTKTSINFHNC